MHGQPSHGCEEQLSLELLDRRINVPWEGRSPRGLTRGANLVILKAQAASRMTEAKFGDQIEMWPTEQKPAPHVWGGGPSLLPLPRR